MKIILSLLCLISILNFSKCQYPPGLNYEAGYELVGSSQIVAGTNPYQVAILERPPYYSDILDGFKFRCSGSLINDQWILTAAQCVENPNLIIALGVHNIRMFETIQQWFDVGKENIVVHPHYGRNNLEDDIALIKLPGPVEYNARVQRIHVDSAGDDYVNETVFLAGWGSVNHFNPVSDYLRQAILKVISNSYCQTYYKHPFYYIRGHHICTATGNQLSQIAECAGDVGAPLVYFNSKRSRLEQVGVMSRVPFTCTGDQPTVYARISSYRKWINMVVYNIYNDTESPTTTTETTITNTTTDTANTTTAIPVPAKTLKAIHKAKPAKKHIKKHINKDIKKHVQHQHEGNATLTRRKALGTN